MVVAAAARLEFLAICAYLVVGPNHAGDIAHGEGLAGLQAEGHRRAAPGVGTGEHHVLHPINQQNQ
jgi:hypothetical protein